MQFLAFEIIYEDKLTDNTSGSKDFFSNELPRHFYLDYSHFLLLKLLSHCQNTFVVVYVVSTHSQ